MGKQGLFRYEIIIEPLRPPFTGNHFTANAIIYENIGQRWQVIETLKENYGPTGQVAGDKASQRAQEWIDKQQ